MLTNNANENNKKSNVTNVVNLLLQDDSGFNDYINKSDTNGHIKISSENDISGINQNTSSSQIFFTIILGNTIFGYYINYINRRILLFLTKLEK